MKFMTVICEYNPFHNGHAYQIEQQKKALGCDGVICLMSGSFVQRGEPAICDKWARAEMAIKNGCDLVFELPVLYSLQSAEGFARGAVGLLSMLNVDGFLAFGSESGNLDALWKIAETKNHPDFTGYLQKELEFGVSYAKAYSEALKRILGDEYNNILENPNDVLGIEYISALKVCTSHLSPALIIRKFGQHDSQIPEKEFLSASGIRNRIYAQQTIKTYMPPSAYDIFCREQEAGRCPVITERLNQILTYKLRTTPAEKLKNISGIREGLENRLIEGSKLYQTVPEIAEFTKTKRYTTLRINRVLMNILLGITKQDEAIKPAYARILGLKKSASHIAKHLSQLSDIPLITKASNSQFTSKDAKRLWELDTLATDLYAMLYPDKKEGRSGLDFYRSPIII